MFTRASFSGVEIYTGRVYQVKGQQLVDWTIEIKRIMNLGFHTLNQYCYVQRVEDNIGKYKFVLYYLIGIL